jgi:hypothetical protein
VYARAQRVSDVEEELQEKEAAADEQELRLKDLQERLKVLVKQVK